MRKFGRPRSASAAVAVAVAIVGGCDDVDSDRKTRSSHVHPVEERAAEAPKISNRDRLAAMLSVHAHARWRRTIPEDVRVIPLEDAARILRRDTDPLAWSRRRRAVARLMAYGRLGEDFRQELETLGADVPAIAKTLRARTTRSVTAVRWIPAQAPTPAVDDADDPAQVDCTISNLLVESPDLADLPEEQVHACEPRCERPPIVTNTKTTVVMEAKISVALPVDDVVTNVDPQRWDECSKFWHPPPDETLLAERNADGTIVWDTDGKIKHGPPESPGSEYGPSPLYEHFYCNTTGCNVSFQNMLMVTTTKTEVQESASTWPGRVMFYGLPCTQIPCEGYISGTISGNDVAVVVDEGNVLVWDQGGRRFVHSYKKVEFQNPVATGFAETILGFSELNSELEELACCHKAGAG